VLTALPGHERLVEALCAYDLIGFQTANDLRAFATTSSTSAVAKWHPMERSRPSAAAAGRRLSDRHRYGGIRAAPEHAASAPDMSG